MTNIDKYNENKTMNQKFYLKKAFNLIRVLFEWFKQKAACYSEAK